MSVLSIYYDIVAEIVGELAGERAYVLLIITSYSSQQIE